MIDARKKLAYVTFEDPTGFVVILTETIKQSMPIGNKKGHLLDALLKFWLGLAA